MAAAYVVNTQGRKLKMANINGCETKNYNSLAKKCRQCNIKEYCRNKELNTQAELQSNIEIRIPQAGLSAQEAADALAVLAKGIR